MTSFLKAPVENYIEAHGGGNGPFLTPVEGLTLLKTSGETLPYHKVYKPALCIVVQGAKQITLGENSFDYAQMQMLVVSIELPAFGRVTRASEKEPFLGLTLEFDVGLMREVMEALDAPPRPSEGSGPGIFVDDLAGPLEDCVTRLLRLLETPAAIPILYPAIMRELCYWLLTGPHGGELCKLALPNSHTQRITDAIYVLRENFTRPIRIEELAAAARMSMSSFHQHFKALTAMTPLQYQKQLRLLEARRLMISDAANVASAAYQVGYESASQFSREYARMFGVPPKRDSMELRELPAPVPV
ncbi:MAG: AraC family transcriptional regulator [Parvibaculaceae bacterium]|nr:AraC family transcriptional regulator [Parvibaculaceae bacterium]